MVLLNKLITNTNHHSSIAYDYMTQNRNSTVRVWVGTSVSDYRYYFNTVNLTQISNGAVQDVYAAFYTVVISMSGGIVPAATNTSGSSIGFIDSCNPSATSEQTCIMGSSNYCVRKEDCGSIDDPGADPLTKMVSIYIAFQGSDSILSRLKSAGMVPTQFSQYSWSQYFGAVSSLVTPSTN